MAFFSEITGCKIWFWITNFLVNLLPDKWFYIVIETLVHLGMEFWAVADPLLEHMSMLTLLHSTKNKINEKIKIIWNPFPGFFVDF